MDVSTDWVNGANLIEDGDTIWGLIMVLLPFTPVAILGVGAVLVAFFDNGCKGCFCYGPLAVALYIPGVVLCTAGYMLFVLVTGFLKVLNPEIETFSEEDLGKEKFCGLRGEIILQIPPMLRMAEVATESYPQSILGESHCPVPNVKNHLPNNNHSTPPQASTSK